MPTIAFLPQGRYSINFQAGDWVIGWQMRDMRKQPVAYDACAG
ncbi:hypothetical protein ACS8YF_04930 [Salinisphaera sp. SWV1]